MVKRFTSMIPVNEGKAVHIAVCVRIIILFPTSFSVIRAYVKIPLAVPGKRKVPQQLRMLF